MASPHPETAWKPQWHQRIKPVAWLRDRLRASLYRFVETIFETDDGRAIAGRALKGLLSDRPALARRDPFELPYAELGQSRRNGPSEHRSDAVFITARFRSGSTLLWNLFRHANGVTAYYEPLNERRWFDPRTRGRRIDRTHKFVDDYWREYDGLEELGEHYTEDWVRRHLYMGPTFWDPALKRYIQTLIDRAAGIPVLQFNRVDFRLPWLRRHFPRARVIHLYRHPRDQWCSALMDIRCFPKDGRMADFAPHDGFYLRIWASDLKYHFPFLDERTVRHPYQRFYYIWRLYYLFGRRYAHYSLAYEDLVADPSSKIAELFRASGIPTVDPTSLCWLVDAPAAGKWKAYADGDWFSRHEAECEGILEEFLGTGRTVRPTRSRAANPAPVRTESRAQR